MNNETMILRQYVYKSFGVNPLKGRYKQAYIILLIIIKTCMVKSGGVGYDFT